MARHGKKPSEESTSPRAPRTLAGSATTNTSADSTDAAASGIAVTEHLPANPASRKTCSTQP